MIQWHDFEQVEIKTGTIVRAEIFEGARKPAIKVWIDLGSDGIKKSSAQIVKHYTPENLLGKQVVCVTNFSPKQIGNFISEVLVTGFTDDKGDVVLCVPDKPVPNGSRLH
jgi:tRNA-binding protein